jgi:hypothetical protein
MVRRVLASLGAFAMATSSAAAQEATPFVWQDVDFTSGCRANPAFDRLLGLLLSRASADAGNADPTIDQPLYNAVSGTASHVLQLGREVPWHGLRLVGVRSYHGIESGPSNLSLVFADSAERVREVWNERGWNLPPVGETRVMEDEAILTAVGVVSDGQHAAVTCFID